MSSSRGRDGRTPVLFDMFELSLFSGKSIGIYNYAMGLLRAMATQHAAQWDLHVVCHGQNVDEIRAAVGQGARLIVHHDRQPGTVRRQWWIRVGVHLLARRLGCRLYFSPKGFLPGWWGPTWGLRTCVVVHDLIPLWYADHHPGYFGRIEPLIVEGGLLRASRHANEVIAVSRATAQDIALRTGRTQGVTVVYNGLNEPPSGLSPAGTATGGEPYIFAMASHLPHKNMATLLAAYRLYRQRVARPLPLVLCGVQGSSEPGVTDVRGLTREQLFERYRGASLFVFLSLAEGFGYPPLEAMQMGVPTLCADLPVLRETTGDNAWFVDPRDAHKVAERMAWALSDEANADRQRLIAAMPQVLERYGWQRAANGVAQVLAKLT